MRVRPLRPTDRGPFAARRPHVIGQQAVATPTIDRHLLAERRHRASVAPEDTALYGCGCGCSFEAPVSTSVACPACGCGQDW